MEVRTSLAAIICERRLQYPCISRARGSLLSATAFALSCMDVGKGGPPSTTTRDNAVRSAANVERFAHRRHGVGGRGVWPSEERGDRTVAVGPDRQ